MINLDSFTLVYSANISRRQIATPPRPSKIFLNQICDLRAVHHVWHTIETCDGAIRLLFIIFRRISTRLTCLFAAELSWDLLADLDTVVFAMDVLEGRLISQVLLAVEALPYSAGRKLVERTLCSNQGVAYGRAYD